MPSIIHVPPCFMYTTPAYHMTIAAITKVEPLLHEDIAPSKTPKPTFIEFKDTDLELARNSPLGCGSYGCVYEGTVKNGSLAGEKIVCKEVFPDEQSRKYGKVEVSMNKKMMSVCPEHAARFLGYYTRDVTPDDWTVRERHGPSSSRSRGSGRDVTGSGSRDVTGSRSRDGSSTSADNTVTVTTTDVVASSEALFEEDLHGDEFHHDGSVDVGDKIVGLVWAYEGDETLSDVLKSKDWLEKLENFFSFRSGSVEPTRTQRVERVFKEVAQQLFMVMEAMHEEKIIHRDIKPANIVLGSDGNLKLIDFGCAADMKTGEGYDPTKGPGDPNYLPPEQFINEWWPDRFDIYSAGALLMQVAFPGLREEAAMSKFCTDLKNTGYNLDRWLQRRLKLDDVDDLREGLAVVNSDESAAWDLLRKMLIKTPRKRITAAAALAEHRYLRGPAVLGPHSRWPFFPETLLSWR